METFDNLVFFMLKIEKYGCRRMHVEVTCSHHFFLSLSAVEASVHGSNVHCTDKTIEAAEALLHMESPTCLRDARSPGMSATVSALGAISPSTNQ